MSAKEYTIIVKKGDEWYLHCLAGYSREVAEERLAYERSKNPDLELDIDELSKEESEDAWWNKWGTN